MTSVFVKHWYDLRCNMTFDAIRLRFNLPWLIVMILCHDLLSWFNDWELLWTFLWGGRHPCPWFFVCYSYGGTAPLPMIFCLWLLWRDGTLAHDFFFMIVMEGRHPYPWFYLYDCYGGTAPLPMILWGPVTCKSYDLTWGTWNCNSYESLWRT